MCHIECGGKCCLRSADAVFCSILLRFAGDSTLLCMTDHEEVIWSLGIVGNALRSRQEVAMLQSVLQPRSVPEKPHGVDIGRKNYLIVFQGYVMYEREFGVETVATSGSCRVCPLKFQ